MPLSEHEQRLLDQIERALYAEDPKFASTVRRSDLRTHLRRRLRRAAVLFAVGFLLLLAGVAVNLALGVAGFVVMLAAALYGLTAWKRTTGRPDSPRPRGRAGRQPRASVMDRFEERWRRRWEERGR